jgi:hypothetical protein
MSKYGFFLFYFSILTIQGSVERLFLRKCKLKLKRTWYSHNYVLSDEKSYCLISSPDDIRKLHGCFYFNLMKLKTGIESLKI